MAKMKHDQTASCRSLHIYGIRRYILIEQRSLNVFQLWIEYKDPLESYEELQSCWLLAAAWSWWRTSMIIFWSACISIDHASSQSGCKAVSACLYLSCALLLHTFPLLLYPFPLSNLSSIPHSQFDSFIVPIVQSACEFITGSRWTLGPQALHIGNPRQAICCEASLIPSLLVCVNLLFFMILYLLVQLYVFFLIMYTSMHTCMVLNPRTNLGPLTFL